MAEPGAGGAGAGGAGAGGAEAGGAEAGGAEGERTRRRPRQWLGLGQWLRPTERLRLRPTERLRLRPTERLRLRLPEDAARVLDLQPDERVLAWSPLVGGGVAAATVQGLRAVTPFGVVVRRPWTDVDHAAWGGQSSSLVVWWVGSRRPLPLELERPGRMPAVVHERVQASVVLAQEIALGAGRWVRVAIRKGPGGALTTQVVPSPGARLDDPEVAGRVQAVTARLQDDAGLA